MTQRRTAIHLATTSEHKKATKCHCNRPNRKLRNVVAKRPTDKSIAMMRKWNKDQYGNKVEIV